MRRRPPSKKFVGRRSRGWRTRRMLRRHRRLSTRPRRCSGRSNLGVSCICLFVCRQRRAPEAIDSRPVQITGEIWLNSGDSTASAAPRRSRSQSSPDESPASSRRPFAASFDSPRLVQITGEIMLNSGDPTASAAPRRSRSPARGSRRDSRSSRRRSRSRSASSPSR